MAPTTFNEWLINTGDKLVLVDTGYSTGAGPMAGNLPKALAAAGVNPADIDAVVITHIHPDHCYGLLTPDKQIAFPNATVHVNGDEFAWWIEGDVKIPEGKPFFKDLFEGGPRGLQALCGREAGADVQGWRRACPRRHRGRRRPGHTVGHTMVRVSPGRWTIADLDRHRPQHGAAIPRAGALDRLRPRSAEGDRYPQEGDGHGGDRRL